MALQARADSSQKLIYRQKIDDLNRKARALFDAEYIQVTKVDYQGKETPLNGYPLPGSGFTKEQIFSDVASQILEKWFNEERPNYPKFIQLNASVSKDNFDRLIKQALSKIANPEKPNRDGEGILNGLGLWTPGALDYSHSPYAKSLVEILKTKGEGKVLNRDEIIEYVDKSDNLWLTKDFYIEAELEFVVMAVLAAIEGIEITMSSGKLINATNLSELRDLSTEDFYSFTHIKFSQDFNEAALKAMFLGILGLDLSKQLKDSTTYTRLINKTNEWANRAVTISNKIQNGLVTNGLTVVSRDDAADYQRKFKAFSGFCDKVATLLPKLK